MNDETPGPLDPPTPRPWFQVDPRTALLHLDPGAIGADGRLRVAVYDRAAARYVITPHIPADEPSSLELSSLDPRHDHAIKMQQWKDGRWVDLERPTSLLPGPEHEIHRFSPAAWGLQIPCMITVMDPETRQVVLRRAAPDPDAEYPCILVFPGGRKLSLSFREWEPDTGRSGRSLSSAIRLVPHAQRGEAVRPVTGSEADLTATTRDDVVLTPVRFKSTSGNPYAAHGVGGAWCDEVPVPESADFVIGKQSYLFREPVPEPTATLEGAHIFLGRLHKSFGHFLTESLARVWYALRKPDVPVIWDGTDLLPYQQEVLDLIGLRNPTVFLRRPVRVVSVVFPDPMIGLGDFVHPDTDHLLGVVPAGAPVPGRKLFISRSRLVPETEGDAPPPRADPLDEIVARHGFDLFHPQEHTLAEQLDVLSSAEVVLGVEGSAFHTVLLLGGPIRTRFWALSRHRGGGGVYEHIRRAKDLRYETLNFLTTPLGSARSSLSLDFAALEEALARTDGLTRDLDILDDRTERPRSVQLRRSAQLENLQVRLSRTEVRVLTALEALQQGDVDTATEALHGLA